MKGGIFVDTSAWYALADAGDINHRRASAFLMESISEYKKLVTTNHIMGETYTIIRYRLGYTAARKFLSNIEISQRTNRIFVSEQIEQKAYQLLERYSDQDFSFIDSTSFVVMKKYKLSDSFTFDKHFSTAGFTILP